MFSKCAFILPSARYLLLTSSSSFMLALLSICVSRVILHLSGIVQAYAVDPLSKAPALLQLTALVDRVAWERKMGCLVFVPPHDDDVLGDTDYDVDDGFRPLKC
jgi:hypothetical protein